MFKDGSLFQRFFYSLGQLIALNLLWFFTSLPLISVGASTAALYHCCLKLRKEKDIPVIRTYLKALRENAKQATLAWLMIVSITLLLVWEQRFLRSTPGLLALVLGYLQWLVGLLLVILAAYIFPVIAAFRNRLRLLIGHAFFFFFKKIHYGLATILLIVFPLWVTVADRRFFAAYLFIWLLCGISGIAYLQSCLLWRLFRPYLGGEEGKPCADHDTDQYVF